MWEIDNFSQLTGVLYSAAVGAIYSFVYDIFRAARKTLRHSAALVFFEDIVFSFICAVSCFCFLLAISGGEMRGYVFFGILCGFTLFRVTASRFSLFIFKKLFCLLHFLTLKNRLFLISLLISLALVTWYSIERIPYCVQLNSEFLNDENLMGFFEISYTNWIGSHNIYLQQNIFYMAIPILATLPFGSSFYDDINRGYARNVCVRAKKKYYLVAKYIAVFVSGGCVVAIPMVLSFLISSIFLPSIVINSST